MGVHHGRWKRASESTRGPGLVLVLAIVLASSGRGAVQRDTLAVRERSGSRLEARGDELWRVRGEVEEVLRVLAPEGLGVVHALEPGGFGGTWVAAQHGLFLASDDPEVEAVDRFDLRDGAPTGAPIGLHLDRERRLWVLTPQELGVIDPVWGYGRVVSSEDLPAAPFASLAVLPGGGVRVRNVEGRSGDYRPDRSEGPRISSVRPERGPVLEAGGPMRLSLTWPQTLRLAVAAEGRGGASIRYFVDEHHRWRAARGPGEEDRFFEVGELRPGLRKVSLVAFDQDLRRSRRIDLLVEVAYPWYLSQRGLLGLLGAFCALVVGFALFRARRARRGPSGYRRALAGAVLIVWLVLMALAGIFPHARGWPFVGFSMYTQSTPAGGVVSDVTFHALRGEERVPLAPWQVTGVVDSVWVNIRPFLNGGPEVRRSLLQSYRKRRNPPADGLAVIATRSRLTPDGPVRVAPIVMALYRDDAEDR